MIKSCTSGDVDEAYKVLSHLWYMGYAAEDIITNIFRVCKNYDMSEYLKLEFIKVSFFFRRRRSSVVLKLTHEHDQNGHGNMNEFQTIF